MKKLLLLFVIVSVFESQATILTVSNRQGNSAQYQSVQEAIGAAAAGDTIYIQGSETSYGDINVDKKITIIGTGHKPNKEMALVSELGAISLDVENSAASGSSFIGLKIRIINNSTYAQKNITIKRCNIGNIMPQAISDGITTNWIIENNIFTHLIFSIDKTKDHNFIIRNNIIQGIVHFANSCIINNNIFISNRAPTISSFAEVYYATIHNNIFIGSTPEGAHNSTFNNNISYSNANSALPYGTNNGNQNQVDIDPKFTVYTEGESFNYGHDYRLQTSSSGKEAGTDGTDIGIYGGMGFSETGEPPIPQIRAFSILNGVLAPNGKLNILLKAEAKN